VPQAGPPLRRMCRDYFGVEGRVVGEDIDYGLEVRTDNPAEVGADRLVNAVAAHCRYPGALIVLDFGTATTFDVVAEDGAYCGGVIAPGINLSLEALHRAAAKLPRVAVTRPQAVIGRNTVAAMQSGIFWGYVGLIEGLVGRLRAEYERPMTSVATGGLAHLFGGATTAIEHVDADLTMAGLVEIYHNQTGPGAV
jgi:type III pantothenate kinase